LASLLNGQVVGQTRRELMESWTPFESGSSIGKVGSERGSIILDEEHPKGARITIERDGNTAPFAITCGVYGWMVHTRFFATEAEARSECGSMKTALDELIDLLEQSADDMDVAGASCSRFVERFP
jgi:hypothetical protein